MTRHRLLISLVVLATGCASPAGSPPAGGAPPSSSPSDTSSSGSDSPAAPQGRAADANVVADGAGAVSDAAGDSAIADAADQDAPVGDSVDATADGVVTAPDGVADATADAADAADATPPLWELPPWVDQLHFLDVLLDEDGESPDLTFKLPPGHHSFLIVVTGDEPTAWHMLAKLVTPQGKPVVKPSGGFDCIPCQNRVVAAHTIATFLFPNTPDLPAKAGSYVLRVQASLPDDGGSLGPWSGGLVHVAILMAKGDAPPPLASLDLALRFTGSGGVTAASAPEDPRLQQALAELGALYASAGVALGDVTYGDAPPELSLLETVTGPDSDLAALLSQAAGPPGVLDVFFVDQILVPQEEGAGIVLGIAGGIPGPALLPGTVHSGVAVSTLPPFGPVDHLGTVLAHEIGHYLGLFHIVEDPTGPYVPDPLSDTPDDDTLNVMWWSVDGSVEQSAKHLSGQQAEVMRRNPATRPADGPP